MASEHGGGDQISSWHLPALPEVLLTGWPVYPAATADRLTRRAGLQFVWERQGDAGDWEPAGSGLSYAPGAADLGRRLRLLGRQPGQPDGPAALCVQTAPVRPGPGPCPFQQGHRLTEHPLGQEGFRLVTYNMLADFYVLMFRTEMTVYCPLEFQDIEYRKQGLLFELLGYHADVLCLQEVDEQVFGDYWSPMLEAAGFSGTFAVKRGPTDGSATFWSNKFRMLNTVRLVISELATTDPLFDDVQKVFGNNSQLKDSFMQLPQVLQVTLLEETAAAGGRPARRLLVANVHLYHHRRTEHLRALQIGVCLRYLQRRLETLQTEEGAGAVTLVFSGDFNSQPHRSVYHLMTTGQLRVQDFNECAEEAVPGVVFSHPYRLGSACGTPEVTTSTSTFFGCLDYIFYMQDRLKVQQTVPLPTPEEVRDLTALPSRQFPSDHLALVADFHWAD